MQNSNDQNSAKHNRDYEWGIYKDKVPYLIKEKGEPSIIIFEPSRELVKNVTNRVEETIKTYNMILPPGCSLCVLGYDPNLPSEYTPEEIAEINAEFLREKYRPGIIIGISYGGFISIPFAALYPELVQKMVLMVSAYAASPEGIVLMKEFTQLIEGENHYQVVKKFNSLIFNPFLRILSSVITMTKRKSFTREVNPSSTFINAYNQIIKTNGEIKKYLPMIKAPTLVIGGDSDQFFSEELFLETAGLIPNGRAEIYENQGHYVIIEKMKPVKKVLFDFLEIKNKN